MSEIKWEYYEEHLWSGKINFMFHSVRDQTGKNVGRFHDKKTAILIASAPDMLALLRELEFVLEDEKGDAVLCPVCVQKKHADTCELAKLLKEVGK